MEYVRIDLKLNPNIFVTNMIFHTLTHQFIHPFVPSTTISGAGTRRQTHEKEDALPLGWMEKQHPFIQQLFTKSQLALCQHWWIIANETDWTALIELTF